MIRINKQVGTKGQDIKVNSTKRENKENEVTVMNAWCDQDVDENSDDAYFKITLMFPDPCPEVTVQLSLVIQNLVQVCVWFTYWPQCVYCKFDFFLFFQTPFRAL